MSVHELNPVGVDVLPDNALERMKHWAAGRPLQVALRHKRRGRWKAWRWVDVLHEVARLGVALQRQGFGPGSRLALSGALEPTAILLALAAQAAGGQVVPVCRRAEGGELRGLLLRLQPSHVFVQSREGVSRWLEAAQELPRELLLFSAQSAARRQGNCRVLPLAALEDDRPVVPLIQPWRAVRLQETVWCEEGSEWREGLGLLLRHWLDSGSGFAFPESSESAARDRRDVAPTALLLSEGRRQALAAEIEQRLAPAGSWSRQVSDWALHGPERGLQRWIAARVRELLGLRRLERLLPGEAAPPLARPAPAWLGERREQAA
ncbi:AMP-binding enzyme [Azotobacter beijerinckii]|uniref:AMP-binding enzyme n=1 Tax=Azotobacter beijerinckii TaxID=170623 RepID=A0A1H9EBQ3_9GAMM|nr:AMP-binding protein [Azotobacter beijerinckii]SEQ22408.1 AMP-binding enzyme [Azotobacter beijerinckii]